MRGKSVLSVMKTQKGCVIHLEFSTGILLTLLILWSQSPNSSGM